MPVERNVSEPPRGDQIADPDEDKAGGTIRHLTCYIGKMTGRDHWIDGRYREQYQSGCIEQSMLYYG